MDRSVVKVIVGVVTALVVLICLTVGIFSYKHLANPVVNLPNPTLPNPNAFDTYVAAGQQLVDTEDIGDAVSRNPKRHRSLNERKLILARNTQAKQGFEKAFSIPYLQPPVRSMFTRFPYFLTFRNFARLKSMESKVYSESGDYGKSVKSAMDAVHFGNHIQHGAGLIGGLVGMACQAIGKARVWDDIHGLSAVEAKEATSRMEGIYQSSVPFAEVLIQEKYTTEAAMLEMIHNPADYLRETGPDDKSTDSTSQKSDNAPMTADRLRAIIAIVGKQQIIDNVEKGIGAIIKKSQSPYSSEEGSARPEGDAITEDILQTIEESEFKERKNRTQNALMLTALAIRAFQTEQGHLPKTLTELTPHYLKQLPDDPFAPSGPLHYKIKNSKALIYSIGPDATDDGGIAIDNPGEKGTKRYSTTEDSSGDIVAGINRI